MRYIRTIQEMIDMQVSETISRIDPITEMAVPLKKYKVRVDGLRFHLVRNWCLCRYCQLFDTTNICFKHWINELEAVIEKFLRLHLHPREGEAFLNEVFQRGADVIDGRANFFFFVHAESVSGF